MQIRIKKDLLKLIAVSLIVGGVFMVLSSVIGNRLAGFAQAGSSVNLFAIFLTGLFTGGLTCLAVQGGLLTATLAQREEERLRLKLEATGNAIPILSFLMSKLLAYTILGMLLGWFGSLFQLSLSGMAILQIAVGVFMLGTALNMLNVHPVFRYFIVQPPRFITRHIRKKSKSGDIFAPMTLGAFTVFIPCGTTQAMMALAIASANPWMGLLIMFAFILGTSPIFFLLGYLTTKLSETLHGTFMRVAAYMIIILALFTVNNSLALAGMSNLSSIFSGFKSVSPKAVQANNNPTIFINNEGYYPQELTVQAGEKVTIELINDGGYGCQQAFAIPKLGIQEIVGPGEKKTISFTAPAQKGDLAFMCSMGMFTGVIHVI